MPTGTAVPLVEYLATIYEPDCDYVDGEIQERNVGEHQHARLQLKVGAYLLTHYEQAGFHACTEVRVQVNSTRFRIPDVCVTIGDPGEQVLTKPPFLCIEILSPEDRMSRLEVRIQDYLQMGVPNVWVLDPHTRQAYVATAVDGLREVKSGVLRTENLALEMPLFGLWG
jgi:Uma2 family endonuclease